MEYYELVFVCYDCGNKDQTQFDEELLLGEVVLVCLDCNSTDTGEMEVLPCSSCDSSGKDEDDEVCDWCEGSGWIA